eukprot:CAMPEP_0171983402 /NCGR_PEP_ID=MMETSP0993-20121228/273279_1 /TAXON_ID=483369 /ORGANISM="non described non described, Strain CCMP2098" /LENGTH=466 /DNA_ID=CAMNT_0012636167 /DNA_START=81 /DNA_END=1482 /DNA_ORIENTATION=+
MELPLSTTDLRINSGGGRPHSDSSSPSPKTISDFPLDLPNFSVDGTKIPRIAVDNNEHQLRPRESKADQEEPSMSGVFKKKKSAWCKVGQRVVVKQTNAKAVIVSISGAWINIRFDQQIKPGKPRGFRVSELRRGTAEGEEDEEDQDPVATQEESFRAAAQLQPMRRSSRRAAQTSSFAISDEEDELNSLDFCNGPLGRRVKRCGSGMVLPRNNRHHFESSHNFSNYRAVPLFQMFGHLPVFGEEAGAGLLLETLVLMGNSAAQTSSFAISDEEDELNNLDFCNGPLGRRVKRCESGRVLPRNNYRHFEPSHNFFNHRAVPLFQTFGHLPVCGEEAGAGLLLESLALMRELQHIRRAEALDRKVAAEELVAAAENKQVLKGKAVEGKAEALPPPPQGKTDAVDDQSSTPPPSVDTAVAAHEWQGNGDSSLLNSSKVSETEGGPSMELDKPENLPAASGINEPAIGS